MSFLQGRGDLSEMSDDVMMLKEKYKITVFS